MSKNSKKNGSNKINHHEDITGKSINKEKCKVISSNSENTFKRLSQLKTTLSTKSWSSSTKAKSESINNEETLEDLQKLSLSNEPEEFGKCSSNLLRARDSLENLLKSERTFFENVDISKIQSPSTSSTPETISPRSLPILNDTMTLITKPLTSESYNKVSKNRGKKEKKKKSGKGNESASYRDQDRKRDFKSGDDKTTKESITNNTELYNFQPKSSKSVVFTNDVMVVYFNGEHVISESKEPLKKELEQQIRNKEMRKGHLLIN